MTLTPAEEQFLARQPRGYLATLAPNGTPQVKPVGFSYYPETGFLDITGFNMTGSAKYRNVQAHPEVAFVVDEVTAPSMEGTHFLEIRGTAEVTTGPHDLHGHLAREVIRIHPRRVVSWNVTSPGFASRDLGAADVSSGSEVA